MSIEIAGTTFDRVEYDAEADVLYLHHGEPCTAVEFDASPEGHALRASITAAISSASPSSTLAGCLTTRARSGSRSQGPNRSTSRLTSHRASSRRVAARALSGRGGTSQPGFSTAPGARKRRRGGVCGRRFWETEASTRRSGGQSCRASVVGSVPGLLSGRVAEPVDLCGGWKRRRDSVSDARRC